MKRRLLYWIPLFVIVSVLFSFRARHDAAGNDCMMAVTYSEMAFSQFKKAYKATSVADAQKLVKKGMEQAQQTAAYAVQCNCTAAETYSLTAYTTAQKSLKSPSLQDLQAGAKKAMNLCLDAMSAAQQCNK